MAVYEDVFFFIFLHRITKTFRQGPHPVSDNITRPFAALPPGFPPVEVISAMFTSPVPSSGPRERRTLIPLYADDFVLSLAVYTFCCSAVCGECWLKRTHRLIIQTLGLNVRATNWWHCWWLPLALGVQAAKYSPNQLTFPFKGRWILLKLNGFLKNSTLRTLSSHFPWKLHCQRNITLATK